MSKQQTAVDWLMEQITYDNGYGQRHNSFKDGVDLLEYFNQAKQIEEKQQGYSEEEVLKFLNDREDYINSEDNIFNYQSIKEWFEQFKKK